MFSQHSCQLNGNTLAVRAIGQPIQHTAYTVDLITFSVMKGHPGEHRTGHLSFYLPYGHLRGHFCHRKVNLDKWLTINGWIDGIKRQRVCKSGYLIRVVCAH